MLGRIPQIRIIVRFVKHLTKVLMLICITDNVNPNHLVKVVFDRFLYSKGAHKVIFKDEIMGKVCPFV